MEIIIVQKSKNRIAYFVIPFWNKPLIRTYERDKENNRIIRNTYIHSRVKVYHGKKKRRLYKTRKVVRAFKKLQKTLERYSK